ncbi:alpha/beta hydrolase-fold protein [uncultured Draconibacterium sp.]|uniref:esterase n=1 Tax=uncultured Draconibacterium sp. TaxID=1573823 RepID=UPI002AA7FBFA|nr:alpha/beta hydrolase-fold protein [uncultured Draconibacterium sp.]
MKQRILLSALMCLLFALPSLAQQNLFGGQDLKSAVVNDDNTVTFRFLAPDAKKVEVAGDFAEKVEENPVGGVVGTGLLPMTKDANGVWSLTTKPLQSELYMYLFVVDGVATTDPNNPYVFRDFATVSNIFIVGNGKADLYKVNDVAHGSLTHRWYNSKSLGMDRRINIYTPPGYENNTKKYPVLYLLHGYGGDEDEWVTYGRATQILDNLISQGKAEPMLVVMPNGHTAMEAAPGESSLGFYKPGGEEERADERGAFESAFTEIINFVESNYRVKPEKESRAIAGLSMGGFHSIHISRINENTFDYVGVFSSANSIMSAGGEGIYANFQESLKKQKDNGVELYWLGIGKDDFLYDANKEFRATLDNVGMKYTFMETEGGHIWKCWREYLSEFTPLLFK